MTFVCYSLALAILGFAYEWPDLTLAIAMLIASRFVLRSS
jgi:hypothetical protein